MRLVSKHLPLAVAALSLALLSGCACSPEEAPAAEPVAAAPAAEPAPAPAPAQGQTATSGRHRYYAWYYETRYIQEVLDDKLELRRQTKEAIFAKMTAHGYEHIEGDTETELLVLRVSSACVCLSFSCTFCVLCVRLCVWAFACVRFAFVRWSSRNC